MEISQQPTLIGLIDLIAIYGDQKSRPVQPGRPYIPMLMYPMLFMPIISSIVLKNIDYKTCLIIYEYKLKLKK